MDDIEDTQWTPAARQAYSRRADQLADALRSHVAANLDRSGRDTDMGSYLASVKALREAVAAFDDAEFDWCGSFPLGFDADDEDEDQDEWEDDDDQVEAGQFLTLSGQWDFRLTDPTATIQAGRAAYLRAWPDDSADDADARVQDVRDAASEVLHAEGVNGLLQTNGLAPLSYSIEFHLHDGTPAPEQDDETD